MRRPAALATAAVVSLALAGLAVPARASTPSDHSAAAASGTEIESMPIRSRAAIGAGTTSDITYHGGKVMSSAGGVKAYVIWYGNWSGNTGVSIIQDFLGSVGGSPYFNINTTYRDANGAVPNIVSLAGVFYDSGSKGTKLSDSAVKAVVSNAISSGLPNDPNGVYFVLTSKGISETSGFLTRYCGWHTHATIGATDIKYSFVGDPTGSKIGNCAAQTTGSPNGNPGADAMVSVIAHELEEAATDPDLNAWYDASGYENADKCAWTFGATYAAGTGIANMKLGTRDYLVQQNWVAASPQRCALTY